ncbi:MAG: hypothetical protein MRY49_02905 [Candidatus Pacebacteria bacterium]|nr:hypothetical protein [Candidatus Paceibacterota bacterium]
MPKTEQIEDSVGMTTKPLKIQRRKGRVTGKNRTSARIRVGCGCCKEELLIFADAKPSGNPNSDTLEIGGVIGTIEQWRSLLYPLLNGKRK